MVAIDDKAMAHDVGFAGTERFELRRRLGAGSFGVVFEALDRQRNAPVALKWLSYADADTVFRFKHEFRSLAEISHPNLVQLFDLERDADRWFFTMELVRGCAVPDYLRPSGGEFLGAASTVMRRRLQAPRRPPHGEPGEKQRTLDVDPAEVRAVFRDLAVGVEALHHAGKLHRDLKCQNVLVTPDRRVVLLDFGMVRELGPSRTSDDLDIAGTPLYMAPEQCSGAPVGPAADWYAFGVMLYRALTDELPFRGRMYEVMAAKLIDDGPSPSQRVAQIPEDLATLCAQLLRRDPDERPNGPEILAALGAASDSPRASFPSVDTEVFVGRRRQLRVLEAARRRVREGLPTAVYVHGASGIGKTSLVRHFLDRIVTEEPSTLVLRGRCFERETLPYKALDSVVDDLVSYLVGLPRKECEELVPPEAGDLAQMFPTLLRVEAIRDAAASFSEAPDPQERRRRAVEAFERLLHRLTRKHEIVVFMDDLQWGDGDSAQLVRPVLHGPDDPPILWIGTYRTDEAKGSAYLEAIHGTSDTDGATLFVEVPKLAEEEARTLLELRLSGTARNEELLDGLSRDAAGNPLLIDLLVRHARDGEQGRSVDLSAVLDERMRDLPEHARRLLAILAVRGRPLRRDLAARVMGVEGLDVTTLTQLRNGKLLRVRERGDEEELELYHDRIREAVSATVPDTLEHELHLLLANALASLDESDPEALAFHYRGAGRWSEAFQQTLHGARRARAALAFEREAELLVDALALRERLEGAVEPDRTELRVALADALRNAGRGTQAADAFLEAARGASAGHALELRRCAAEQYLFSGHLDEARALLRTVLDDVGLSMPEHPARVLAEFLARRAQVRLRGLRFEERSTEEVGERELRRIDVCWSVSVGFAMIDPVRGGIFQARHLLMALDAGDLPRVARAVAVEVPFSATSGDKNWARTEELMRIGHELAERSGRSYTHGLLASSSGGAEWLVGRWERARQLEEKAIDILRRECTGVAWELTSSTIVLMDVLFRMGRWPELFERWPDVLDDALTRGDLLLEIYVRIKFGALTHMAEGRPDEAIREAQEALARWSQPGFQLLHFWELVVRAEAQLYAGRPEAARERVSAGWPSVRRSGLLQLQMYEITWRDLEGRVALASAARAHGRRRASLLDETRTAIKKLCKSGAAWAEGPVGLLRAGVASVEGKTSVARRELAGAERALEATDMSLHALVARARAAELERRDADRETVLGALAERALAEPEQWLELLAPGSYRG